LIDFARVGRYTAHVQKMLENSLNHRLKIKTPIDVIGVSVSKFEQRFSYSCEAIPVGLPKRSMAQRKPRVDIERRSSR